MIASLSESLIKAYTALEYLTVDPRFSDLAAWQHLYQEHLAHLYARAAELRTHSYSDVHGRAAPLVDLSGGFVSAPVLPTFSARKAASVEPGQLVAPRLLVVIGDEDASVDLAAVRAAARAGGFEWQRLKMPTMGEFAREMSRARQHGKPYTWLHLGAHGGPEGVELADGVASGVWLSAQMRDVDVLLLASCSGCGVGDQLGVVPWVVAFAEAIETNDAASFCSSFWMAMGRHRRADEAVDEALLSVSLEVAEFVRRYW
jgi:hypothetical protein